MNSGWTDEETFHFWMPAQAIEIEKGGKKNKDGKRWIQGIASTDTKDLQGEVVHQNGIDFTYFLKHGYFNNDHKKGFANKVGQPTECRVTKNGLWVKGFLFKNHDVSDEIWELLNALEASGANRKIGFSIEGKVVRRDNNKIKECWIQDVAITPAPVNSSTWAEIAKSLSAQKWDFVNKSADKDAEDEEKAMAAAGNPLVKESLDSDAKENRSISKSISFEEAVQYYMVKKGLTRETAEHVTTVAFYIFG